MRGGQQPWEGVGGFHGGVRHEMPGGEEHGDATARVHDDVLIASGEPPAFEQKLHLAARLVDADDPARVRDARIRERPPDLQLAQFSECPCRCCRPLLPEVALGFPDGVVPK